MSSGSHNNTTTNKIDPTQFKQYQDNYRNALGVADLPYTPWTGESVAGFTPDQNVFGGILKNTLTNQPGSDALGAAIAGANGVLGFNPATVSSNDVRAGMLRDTNLDPYMNPYINSVIGSTMGANERARQVAQVANNQQAMNARAFGGSRSGVLGALTNEAYDRNNLDAVSRLMADAFSNAQGAATGDINRRLGADQVNAGNALTASQANAANGLNANAQRLSAAGVLGNLGNAQFGNAMTAANAFGEHARLDQMTRQAQDDAAYREFLRQLAYPQQQQDIRNQALSMIPVQQSVTQHNSGSMLGGFLRALEPMGGFLNALGGGSPGGGLLGGGGSGDAASGLGGLLSLFGGSGGGATAAGMGGGIGSAIGALI